MAGTKNCTKRCGRFFFAVKRFLSGGVDRSVRLLRARARGSVLQVVYGRIQLFLPPVHFPIDA